MLKQFLFVYVFAAIGVVSTGYAAEAGWAPQTSSEHGVKVVVTPHNLSSEENVWNFDLQMETHSRNLDEDMAKSSLLVVDGIQYVPIGWEGSPPGTHHRKGLLRFKAIAPQAVSVELQIRLIGEPLPRNFSWRLK